MKTIIKTTVLLAVVVCMPFNSFLAAKSHVFEKVYSKPAIKWKVEEVALGNVEQNKPVNIEFEFTNTGDSPVIISSVQASCGCTATNYSKTPVMPGESTKISATFNAAVKGAFKKTITVITNAEEAPKTLIFNGTVI